MWLRERVKAWRGTAFLSLLWLAATLSRPFGLNRLYDALLAQLVERTGLFDSLYYLETNGDVAESGTPALRHYVAFGDREGRSPIALFDPVFYRLQVRGRLKHVNAVLHYAYVGWYHRKSPSPWFDVAFYLSESRDVLHAGQEPLRHYLTHGGLEGRSPSAQFDGAYYLRTNPDVLAALQNPLLHYLRYGHVEGRRPLPAEGEPIAEGDLAPRHAEPVSPESWSALQPRAGLSDVEVDVVVPVYKGHLETLRCLYSVLAADTSTPFELIVINDASPDRDLSENLERLATQGLFTLYQNSSNRGFVYTANRGMSLHPQRDVVLLNADTEVFDGWLDRLAAAARRDGRTATVTPLSNNATICSYPQFIQDNPYPLELDFAELDGLAADVNKSEEVEVPTAVGFCTYLKRACLNEVGQFDEKTFGRGYGEENDFSLRAAARGWRNVVACDVFVYHSGSASFQGEKAKALHAAMGILEKRYPSYHRDVAAFIERDPLAQWRQRLDWARLCRQSRDKNVIVIVHGRGGGTERHVQEDLGELRGRGFGVYLLRPVPGLPTHFALSHHATKSVPNIRPFAIADTARLAQALRELRITDVHTHSLIDAVSDAPKHVTHLVKTIDARWEANLHDYKVICPRINLADETGRYCGEPNNAACNRCLENRGSIFGRPDIREWRAMHSAALSAADAVLVPDADMAKRLVRYFPSTHFEVSPHDDVDLNGIEIALPHLEGGEDLHIVVIGAISDIKGYGVLLACAKDAKKRRLPLRFTVMGYSVNDRQLDKAGVEVTGRYLEGQGLSLLHSLGPHLIWLPSLWPETYSYTLSLALQAKRPVFAFDIGAIAARLRRINQADMLVPLSLADSPQALNAQLLTYRNRWSAEVA